MAENDNSIYYEGSWGLFSREKIRISYIGVEYGGDIIPLEDIIGIRWGAKKTIFNTGYFIDIKTDKKVLEIKPSKVIFENILKILWETVGRKIIKEILIAFRDGKETGFDSNITDEGVRFVQRTFTSFSARVKVQDDNGEHFETRNFTTNNEKVLDYDWTQISIGDDESELKIYDPDGNCIISFSLVHIYNAQMLEYIIHLAHEKKVKRLSDLLS